MSAVFSDCGQYRIRLDRVISEAGPAALFIGVNPSVGGGETDDPTIRKDIGFAKRHGWGRIILANKFMYVATDVKQLRLASNPKGVNADAYLDAMMREADIIVGAWGPLQKLPNELRRRWRTVAALAEAVGKPIHCFGTANDGQPRHTLMLPYDTPLEIWTPPR